MSLLALACEYRELYTHICARLHPRDAYALACACRRLRASISDVARWYAQIAPSLAAIRHIEYHVFDRMYTFVFGTERSVTRGLAESVRAMGSTITVMYMCDLSTRISALQAGYDLRIANLGKNVTERISTHRDRTSVSVRGGINTYWIAYYTWTVRRLQLCDLLHVHIIYRRICFHLGWHECCALAHANYADFARYMQNYTRIKSRDI